MLLLYVSLLSTMGVLLARCDSPYGPWTEWSDCSVEEGQGTMIRTRACVVQDCPQPGQYTDVMVCFVKACKCKCPSPNPGFISSPTQGPEGQSSAGVSHRILFPEKEITNAPKSGKPSTTGSPKESYTVAGNGEEEQGSPSPTTSAEKSTISRPSVSTGKKSTGYASSEEVSAGRTLSSTETTPTAAQGKSSTSVPEEVSSTVAPGEISSTGTGEAGQGSPSPTSLITFAAIKETTAPGLARLHHSPEIPTSAELPCEDHPLGAAKGGKLPASSFTASSSYDMFPPSQGRLNGPLAWCAIEDKNGEEYLQIHLPEAETICAIATQGTGYKIGNEHVTFYFLEYSKDGHHWKFIEEDGNPKVFTGNTDSKSTAKQVLHVPVKASYIRVIPLEFKEWPCLRVEIYGKEKLKHYHPPAEIEIGQEKQGATTPTTTEESPTGLASSVTFAAIKETTEPAAGSARHHHPSKKPTSAGGPCEDHPLGAAKGEKLPPSSFTASSSYYMYPPSEGRLNGLLAWCANEDKKGEEYLQIHLPEAETICAIATQGTGFKNGNEHVTFYFLEYSKDGHHWKFIEEDRNPKVFTGNRESKSTTKHVLDVPVKASYIRVIPLEFKEWPCLRVEIYGKEKVKHHHPPVEIEIAHGKQGSTKPTITAEVATPRTPEYPPIPTCAAASKGIDLAIIMDSSSGVTAEEFEKLKMFVSVLVESIRSLIPQVQLGFIVYSDEPKLIMTLTPFDDVDVSKIIKDIEYTPGGHRTDLAMLKSKVNLFCHENCQDSPGCDNVMIVFTSKNTDPESLQFSFLSPIIKNATSNVIAVGMKSAVSKSELIKIALGHADHVIKLHSPDNLDSTVIHKIETLICTAKPENKGKKEDVEPPTGRLVTFRN